MKITKRTNSICRFSQLNLLGKFHLWILQYFLKARFHFNKDQFADLMLIGGVAGAVSQACISVFNILFVAIFLLFLDSISSSYCNQVVLQIPFINFLGILQLLFMPLIAPFIDERKLLSLGLFSACVNVSANDINELRTLYIKPKMLNSAWFDQCRCLFAAYLGQLG